MREINFSVTDEEMSLIIELSKRAAILVSKTGGHYPLMDCQMDLTATHLNGNPLNLEKLEAFDSMNFSHDIFGIRANLNRTTGKLKNCFSPRCSA